MAFCPDCGTRNDAAARFCKTCGRPMADVAEVNGPVPPVQDPPPGAHVDAKSRIIGDDGLPAGQDLDGEPGGERLLWQGRPSRILSLRLGLTTHYKLTNERLIIERGLFGRRTEEIELYRVNDIDVNQSFGDRIWGVGDVQIEGSDKTAPETALRNIRDPDRVKDLLRAAARSERQRRRVLMRDEV